MDQKSLGDGNKPPSGRVGTAVLGTRKSPQNKEGNSTERRSKVVSRRKWGGWLVCQTDTNSDTTALISRRKRLKLQPAWSPPTGILAQAS